MGKAVFSYRSHPPGRRGSASSALGYLQIADLRCFFSLVFMPLEPYPARFARHLPHGGRLTIRDMLFFHLFSCPPGCFCFLPSYSPVFPCASKISRFARNDDTGEAVFSFRCLSHREVSGAWALRFYMPAEQPLGEGAR